VMGRGRLTSQKRGGSEVTMVWNSSGPLIAYRADRISLEPRGQPHPAVQEPLTFADFAQDLSGTVPMGPGIVLIRTQGRRSHREQVSGLDGE
jgi:hypothetical protein